MISDHFKLDVAKWMVAAAWADGELQNSEINVLKSLMWELGELNAKDWAEIEMHMDSPVSQEERKTLEKRVFDAISSKEEKQFVEYMIGKLLNSDGVVGQQEQAFLRNAKELIEGADTGLASRIGKLIRSVMQGGRQNTVDRGRESDIEDFLRNKIYYSLKQRGFNANLPDERTRQLSFAAGLLGLVANVDKDICSKERAAVAEILEKGWGLGCEAAEAVVEVSSEESAQGLDRYRLTDGFYRCTSREERLRFMVCLFRIAAASGKASHEEIEEIRDIALGLKLSHQDFIAAKLTLSNRELGL